MTFYCPQASNESVVMSAQCRRCFLKFPVRAVRQHEANCSAKGTFLLKSQGEESGMKCCLSSVAALVDDMPKEASSPEQRYKTESMQLRA